MEKKERKETAKERKRKWSIVVVTGERKESVQGTKRRWDFYEWVDAFKGPRVNSLSKMIYWRKIHLFYVTPWKLFFPSISPRDGVCEGWTRGMHKHSITPAALHGQEGAVGGKRGCQESVTAESVRRGAKATTATRVEEDLVVGKLLLGTDNLTHSPGVLLVLALLFDWFLLRVTEKQRRCKGLFPWTPLRGVEGTACETGSDLGLWTSGQFHSRFWFV